MTEIVDKVVAFYNNRAKVTLHVAVGEPSDAFDLASELYERFEKSNERNRAQRRADLMQHLEKTYQVDADCSAMLYQHLCDEKEVVFLQLLELADHTLSLAQLQDNFHVEVRAVYAMGRLLLDQGNFDGQATLSICSVALPKLRGGMEPEDLYDMWCLAARAAEVMVMGGDISYRAIEIKAYQNARSICKQSEYLRNNYFTEARLLVLLIGNDIGTQQTKEAQKITNERVQAIVNDLQPLKILEWIFRKENDEDKVQEMELSDTLCYIALCMIHGHIPDEKNQKMQLLQCAQDNGADVENLVLWL